jgi:hypothetical protein
MNFRIADGIQIAPGNYNALKAVEGHRISRTLRAGRVRSVHAPAFLSAPALWSFGHGVGKTRGVFFYGRRKANEEFCRTPLPIVPPRWGWNFFGDSYSTKSRVQPANPTFLSIHVLNMF